jgi:hypothetical protein
LEKLAAALKPNGIWYLSFKYGDTQRNKAGRLFTDVNEEPLSNLAQSLHSIEIQQTWVTEDNRPYRDEKWLNAILLES